MVLCEIIAHFLRNSIPVMVSRVESMTLLGFLERLNCNSCPLFCSLKLHTLVLIINAFVCNLLHIIAHFLLIYCSPEQCGNCGIASGFFPQLLRCAKNKIAHIGIDNQ